MCRRSLALRRLCQRCRSATTVWNEEGKKPFGCEAGLEIEKGVARFCRGRV
ncbi:hypothetical protein JHK86_052564 [Glycine max]|nr:hypothetical protein JHK86_052564 [Glycine max]